MFTLKILVGFTLNKIEKTDDCIHLVFSNNTTLSIFNSYTYKGDLIEGLIVSAVIENDKKIIISFKNGNFLIVGLDDKDYTGGPEALLLKYKGNIVVW